MFKNLKSILGLKKNEPVKRIDMNTGESETVDFEKEKSNIELSEKEFNKIVEDIKAYWAEEFENCEYTITGAYKDNEYYEGHIYIDIDVFNNEKPKVKDMIKNVDYTRNIKKDSVFVQLELQNVLKCCEEYAKNQNVVIEITPFTSRMVKFYDIELLTLALDSKGVPVWDSNYYQWLPDEY